MLVLHLEPELEQHVHEAASERGQSVEQFAIEALRREAGQWKSARQPRVSAAGAFAHAPLSVAEFLADQRQEALDEAERDKHRWPESQS